MFANKNNSSIYSINSDRDISLFRKVLWFLLNFINNNLWSSKSFNYSIYCFTPNIAKTDLDKLNSKSESPSFYALVIHSNFNNDIFNDMKSLLEGSVNN